MVEPLPKHLAAIAHTFRNFCKVGHVLEMNQRSTLDLAICDNLLSGGFRSINVALQVRCNFRNDSVLHGSVAQHCGELGTKRQWKYRE